METAPSDKEASSPEYTRNVGGDTLVKVDVRSSLSLPPTRQKTSANAADGSSDVERISALIKVLVEVTARTPDRGTFTHEGLEPIWADPV